MEWVGGNKASLDIRVPRGLDIPGARMWGDPRWFVKLERHTCEGKKSEDRTSRASLKEKKYKLPKIRSPSILNSPSVCVGMAKKSQLCLQNSELFLYFVLSDALQERGQGHQLHWVTTRYDGTRLLFKGPGELRNRDLKNEGIFFKKIRISGGPTGTGWSTPPLPRH